MKTRAERAAIRESSDALIIRQMEEIQRLSAMVDRGQSMDLSCELSECIAEGHRLRAVNAELREALANAERDLWRALGGDDDKENAERANRVCAAYRAALAKARGAA